MEVRRFKVRLTAADDCRMKLQLCGRCHVRIKCPPVGLTGHHFFPGEHQQSPSALNHVSRTFSLYYIAFYLMKLRHDFPGGQTVTTSLRSNSA